MFHFLVALSHERSDLSTHHSVCGSVWLVGGMSVNFFMDPQLFFGTPLAVKGKFFDTRFGLTYVWAGKKNF